MVGSCKFLSVELHAPELEMAILRKIDAQSMVRSFSLIDYLITQYTSLVGTFSPGVFSLPAVFLYSSIESVGSCLVGTVLGLLFFVVLESLEDIQRQKELLSGYLTRFLNCSFYRFHTDDFADKESPIRFEVDSIPVVISGAIRINLKRDIRVYVVKRGRSHLVPCQLVAYESSGGSLSPSLVFVRDEPDKITPLGRFFIYHEVAHTSWRHMLTSSFSYWQWKLFILPVFWAIINLQPSLFSFAVLAFYVLLLIIVQPIYKHFLQQQRFVAEISADQFALSCLSDKDQQALAQYLYRVGKLPKDPKLTDSQNSNRSTLLLQNLSKVKNLSGANSPIQFFFSLPTIYLLFPFAILTLVMGFLSRTPSTTLVCGNSILLVIIFSIYIWLYWKKSKLQQEIESYLLEPRPTTACT
jgi:hypothetical protein